MQQMALVLDRSFSPSMIARLAGLRFRVWLVWPASTPFQSWTHPLGSISQAVHSRSVNPVHSRPVTPVHCRSSRPLCIVIFRRRLHCFCGLFGRVLATPLKAVQKVFRMRQCRIHTLAIPLFHFRLKGACRRHTRQREQRSVCTISFSRSVHKLCRFSWQSCGCPAFSRGQLAQSVYVKLHGVILNECRWIWAREQCTLQPVAMQWQVQLKPTVPSLHVQRARRSWSSSQRVMLMGTWPSCRRQQCRLLLQAPRALCRCCQRYAALPLSHRMEQMNQH